jgi:hypothetical protein
VGSACSVLLINTHLLDLLEWKNAFREIHAQMKTSMLSIHLVIRDRDQFSILGLVLSTVMTQTQYQYSWLRIK